MKRFVPEKQDFIDRCVRIDLKLIVPVAACNEQLNIIVCIDRCIAFRKRGGDVRLLDPVSNVEIFIIP